MLRLAVAVLCLLTTIDTFAARKRANVPELDNIQLPADFAIDYKLAMNGRSRVTGGAAPLTGTALNVSGDEVFGTLVHQSMVSGLGLPYNWRLSILNDSVMNAGSLPDGEIVVNGAHGGLAELLGSNRGLWAATLSHEISHTAYRHGVKMFVYRYQVEQEIAYYEWRVRNGDKNANWSIVGLRIGSAIAAKKLSRDMEHEADIKGMMLMARAGYHPDNVFALHHLVRLQTGDQSKFAAFFSDHPRWETRDQRDEKAFADALAEYNRLWPDPSRSPGGLPPTVVFVGQPHSTEQKKERIASIDVPLLCRNSTEPVSIALNLNKDGHKVPAVNSTFGDSSGNLYVSKPTPCTGDSVVHFAIPADAVSKNDRKLKAEASVFSGTTVLERSKPFDVNIPKL